MDTPAWAQDNTPGDSTPDWAKDTSTTPSAPSAPGLAARILNAANQGLAGFGDAVEKFDPMNPIRHALQEGAEKLGVTIARDRLPSESLANAGVVSFDPSMDPHGNVERYAQSVARAAGGNILPALVTAGVSLPESLAKVAAGEAGAAAGQGVAGQAARDEFPGNPYADAIAQVVGGLGGGIITPHVLGDTVPQYARMTPEEEAAYGKLLKTGSEDDILSFFKDKPNLSVNPDEVRSWIAGRDHPDARAEITYIDGHPPTPPAPVEVPEAKPEVKPEAKPSSEQNFIEADVPEWAEPEAATGGSGSSPPSPPPTGGSGSGEPPEPSGERPKYIQNINVDKGGYTPEQDPFLAKAAEDVNLDPQTHSETIKQAAQMRQEMSPEELVTFDPLKSEAVAHSVALRAQLHEAVAKATDLAQDILDPTKDTAQAQAAFDEAMHTAGFTASAVSDGAKFAGRLLNAHGIKVGPDGAYARGVGDMAGDYTAEMRQEMAQQVLNLRDNPDAVSALTKKLVDPRFRDKVTNALNIPRAIMSSFDLSAPFRQGLGLVGRKEFWTSFGSMIKQFGSEAAHQAAQQEIRDNPHFRLMRKSGLYLAGETLNAREEAFMSSYAEKIPLVGHGIRASERAYTGFLNKVRADTFSSLVDKASDAGIDLRRDPKTLKDIAKFINTATGRGSLGRGNDAAPLLNSIFFSPRLIASRVQMLNPAYYVSLSPFARKEAIKSLLSIGAFGATILGVAKAAGLGVETDPRSSDFAKVRNGNTRYDVLGGFQQYLRLGAELATNQRKTVNGDIQTLGQKYGQPTRLDTLVSFLESKESPVTSFATDYLRGKDAVGQPATLRHEIAQRFVPMVIQDITDVYQDAGAKKAAVSAVPSIFGIGVQDYQPNPKKK